MYLSFFTNFLFIFACLGGISCSKKLVRQDNRSILFHPTSLTNELVLDIPVGMEIDKFLLGQYELSGCFLEGSLSKTMELHDDCRLTGIIHSPANPVDEFVLHAKNKEGRLEKFVFKFKYFIPTYPLPDQVFITEQVYVLSIATVEATLASCQATPELPMGFSMDPEKGCQLSGVLLEPLPQKSYQIDLVDPAGIAGKTTLSMKALTKGPRLHGPQAKFYCLKNSLENRPIEFQNQGEAIERCSVSPSLPSGLSLDPSSCKISGVPHEELQYQNYLITAQTGDLKDEHSVKLAASYCDGPKLFPKQNEDRFYFYKDSDLASLDVVNASSKSIKVCYTIPKLPDGLSIDASSCKISGVPRQEMLKTKYQIIAFDFDGNKDILELDFVVRDAFKSRWRIDEAPNGRHHLRLPTQPNGQYNFIVDWGDGSTSHINQYNHIDVIHFYDQPGEYDITIKGMFHGFTYFYTRGGSLLDVSQFGSLRFKDLYDDRIISLYRPPRDSVGHSIDRRIGFFNGAREVNFSTEDEIDIFGVKRLWYMFAHAEKLDAELNMDTSQVESMQNLFWNAKSYNKPLKFDTSNVKSFVGMFSGALKFNQQLAFDTSNVIFMNFMFYRAIAFNQLVKLDTSNVKDMRGMFREAEIFNQRLEFDTSNVVNMRSMFEKAKAFNQRLEFDTSKVVDMSSMFEEAENFNQPLEFETSNVVDMRSMFKEAKNFNQALKFETSNVVDMRSMFDDAIKFNQPLYFDTSSVENMENMFSNAWSYNQPIEFDTSNVKNMQLMFFNALVFNQTLSFNTSQVTNMSGMFWGALSFNRPLNLDTSKVTDMGTMFVGASSFNQPLSFDTSMVVNMAAMFDGATSFNQSLFFDTSKVGNMSGMFYDAESFNQPLEFDTSNVIYFKFMFDGATSFNQEVSFNLENAKDLVGFFSGNSISQKKLEHFLSFAADQNYSSSLLFHIPEGIVLNTKLNQLMEVLGSKGWDFQID